MLHFVYGAFEMVQLNYKISRTPENEPSANSIHLDLIWVGGFFKLYFTYSILIFNCNNYLQCKSFFAY